MAKSRCGRPCRKEDSGTRFFLSCDLVKYNRPGWDQGGARGDSRGEGGPRGNRGLAERQPGAEEFLSRDEDKHKERDKRKDKHEE